MGKLKKEKEENGKIKEGEGGKWENQLVAKIKD